MYEEEKDEEKDEARVETLRLRLRRALRRGSRGLVVGERVKARGSRAGQGEDGSLPRLAKPDCLARS